MNEGNNGSAWMLLTILALLAMCGLGGVFVLILVAIAVPGFMRAREVSRRNNCQATLVQLDGALTQYMLANNLSDVESAALALGPSSQNTPGDSTWQGTLVGQGGYYRGLPTCPAGGVYVIDPTATHPMACSLSTRGDVNPAFWHTYPQPLLPIPVPPRVTQRGPSFPPTEDQP